MEYMNFFSFNFVWKPNAIKLNNMQCLSIFVFKNKNSKTILILNIGMF